MQSYTIEIDDEVFRYLQSKAQPLVDTPNAVLRRLLLLNSSKTKTSAAPMTARHNLSTDLPTTPFGTPAALQQTLWVTYLVRKNGRPRPEATSDVAKALHVAPQTVLDKYCRQLGLTAMQFDLLLREPQLAGLRSLLVQKFPEHEDTVRGFLKGLETAA